MKKSPIAWTAHRVEDHIRRRGFDFLDNLRKAQGAKPHVLIADYLAAQTFDLVAEDGVRGVGINAFGADQKELLFLQRGIGVLHRGEQLLVYAPI